MDGLAVAQLEFAAAMTAPREFQSQMLWAPPRAGTRAAPAAWRPGQPLDLEIGAGVGWRAIVYARENPSRSLIAIERTADKFARFSRRLLANPPAANLLPVHADAVPWICARVRPGSISRCFLFYPNPCPKNPSGRWFRMPFMRRLVESLENDGEVWLATNLPWYADEAMQAAASWGLEPWLARTIDPCQPPRTHFERKYLARGEECLEVAFRRTASSRASLAAPASAPNQKP